MGVKLEVFRVSGPQSGWAWRGVFGGSCEEACQERGRSGGKILGFEKALEGWKPGEGGSLFRAALIGLV